MRHNSLPNSLTAFEKVRLTISKLLLSTCACTCCDIVPLKLPSNTLRGLNAGLSRGIKRKAEDIIKKEITKQAKKALSHKNVKQAVRVATALFPKQTKRARDILGV